MITALNAGLAVIGGLLISASTSLNMLARGRITGCSGILYSLVTLGSGDSSNSLAWKVSFVAGMALSSAIVYLCSSLNMGADGSFAFAQAAINVTGLSFGGFALGGFLVGVGTKLANGCTSGHGVCGLPRWSPRSWVAVGTFMAFGIATATLHHYKPFLASTQALDVIQQTNYTANAATVAAVASLVVGRAALIAPTPDARNDALVSATSGALFGAGLAIGGMLRRDKILGFLTMSSAWDPQLLVLFLSAVGANMVTFHFILNKRASPVFAQKFQVPTNRNIDARLVAGAAIFGIGWGLVGLCPGPVMSLFTQFTLQISVVWLVCAALGQVAVTQFDEYMQQRQVQAADATQALSGNDKKTINVLDQLPNQ